MSEGTPVGHLSPEDGRLSQLLGPVDTSNLSSLLHDIITRLQAQESEMRALAASSKDDRDKIRELEKEMEGMQEQNNALHRDNAELTAQVQAMQDESKKADSATTPGQEDLLHRMQVLEGELKGMQQQVEEDQRKQDQQLQAALHQLQGEIDRCKQSGDEGAGAGPVGAETSPGGSFDRLAREIDALRARVDSLERDRNAGDMSKSGTNPLDVLLPQSGNPQEDISRFHPIQLYNRPAPGAPTSSSEVDQAVQVFIDSLPHDGALMNISGEEDNIPPVAKSREGGSRPRLPADSSSSSKNGSSSSPVDASSLPTRMEITPSAVVHPEHYVLFQGGEGVFGSGVPTTGQQQAVHLGIPEGTTEFTMMAFDLRDKEHRAQVEDRRDRIAELQRQTEDALRKVSASSRDRAALQRRVEDLERQVKALNRKLEEVKEVPGFKAEAVTPRRVRLSTPRGGSPSEDGAMQDGIPVQDMFSPGSDSPSLEKRLIACENMIEDMLARLGALGSEHRRNSSLEASAQIQMDDLQAALDSLRKRLVAVEGKLLGLGGLSQHGTAPGGSGALENTPTSDSGNIMNSEMLEKVAALAADVDLLKDQLMKMAVVRELPNKFSKLERLVGKKADQSSLDDLVESMERRYKEQQMAAATIESPRVPAHQPVAMMQERSAPTADVIPAASDSANSTSMTAEEQASIHEELRALRKALNEHARLLDGLDDRKIDRSELHKAINKLMEDIEELRSTKADGDILVRKCDKDVVEGQFERMKKEFRDLLSGQASSATNAIREAAEHLAAMIDDKADRTDVRRVKEFLVRYLQENSPEEGPGGDGLAGAKGFRCLSCNRPIPKMRVRPGAPVHEVFNTTSSTSMRQRAQMGRPKIPELTSSSPTLRSLMASPNRLMNSSSAGASGSGPLFGAESPENSYSVPSQQSHPPASAPGYGGGRQSQNNSNATPRSSELPPI